MLFCEDLLKAQPRRGRCRSRAARPTCRSTRLKVVSCFALRYTCARSSLLTGAEGLVGTLELLARLEVLALGIDTLVEVNEVLLDRQRSDRGTKLAFGWNGMVDAAR